MPQAPVITENIIKLIAEIYSTDKTLVAKQVLAKVHEALGRSDWPKLSVIQRELKKLETGTLQSIGRKKSDWTRFGT